MCFFIRTFIGLEGINREFYVSVVCSDGRRRRRKMLPTAADLFSYIDADLPIETVKTKLFPSINSQSARHE